jgi:hypothetical protein
VPNHFPIFCTVVPGERIHTFLGEQLGNNEAIYGNPC